MVLPPTDPALADADTRPYFLWWTEATVGEFRQRLASSDPTERAYWMGALLREANTRDVWLFVTPRQIRDAWMVACTLVTNSWPSPRRRCSYHACASSNSAAA